MKYVDISALFVPTFLGAFLAFGLENLRERRRLTEWVRQHLGHLRDIMVGEADVVAIVDETLGKQIAACDAWLAAPNPEAVTEQQWELLDSIVHAHPPDFGAVLRSEAITAIPADLALAMAQTESAGATLANIAAAAQTTHEAVLPLWFERIAPLSEADSRRLRRLRDTLVQLAGETAAARVPLQQFVDQVNDWLD